MIDTSFIMFIFQNQTCETIVNPVLRLFAVLLSFSQTYWELMFYQIIFRILVFLLFEEYATDAFQLNTGTIDETAEERTVAKGAITGDGARLALMNEGYATVFLEREGKRTVFATTDVGADFFLAGIVGIKRKGHSPDA